MLRCDNCGLIFKDDDLEYYQEDTGETWGMCPACNRNDIGEVHYCTDCKQWHEQGDCDYCENCDKIHKGKCEE